MNTFGSDFNTTLAIYSGRISSRNSQTLRQLHEVASNNDAGGLQREVIFNAVAERTYQIAADGFGRETGNIDLNLALDEGQTVD